MNILVIANKFPYPPKDGGAIATLSLIKGFHQNGANVTVAAINTSKHYFDISKLPDEVSQIADFNDCYINTDIKIGRLISNLLFSNLPYNAERFISNDFKKLLIKILSNKTFDIIQLEGNYLCPYIPLIKQYSKALISYRSHNIEHEIWHRTIQNTSNFVKKVYLKILADRLQRMEKNYINKYDLLIPITEKDGECYSSYGNIKPIHICPTGIDIELQNPESTNYKFKSVFQIGTLDWAPNQQGLLWFIDNCWSEIYKLFPDVNLRIAGRNAPEWLKLKLNKTQGVDFVGEVEDAHQFFCENAIMIVPLFAGSGMRIKIIEGLALGKPIVSTAIGAEGINAKDNSEIFIADTAREFIDTISHLLKNTRLIGEVGQNALNFAHNNFNNTIISAKLLAFYEQHISNT